MIQKCVETGAWIEDFTPIRIMNPNPQLTKWLDCLYVFVSVAGYALNKEDAWLVKIYHQWIRKLFNFTDKERFNQGFH